MNSRAALKICWLGRDCQYVTNTTGITPFITITHFTVPQSIGVCYFDLAMSRKTALKICWFGRDCQYVINTTMHRNKHNITYLFINTAGITLCITINHFSVPQSTGVCYFDLAMSSWPALRICWLGRDCQYVTYTTVIIPCITINHFNVPTVTCHQQPRPGAPPPDLGRLQRVLRHEKLWNYVTWPVWENSNVFLFQLVLVQQRNFRLQITIAR